MDTINLTAQKRDLKVKAKDLRTNGQIPGIFYGAKQKNLPLTLNRKIFTKTFEKAGENTVLDLNVEDLEHSRKVEGEKTPLKVLVHAVELDPVNDEIQHVDFIHVDMNKKITTHVPLHYIGVASAVKDLGGTLTVSRNEISIRCLPADLPHSIDVDISILKEIHASIHLGDLTLPSGVEVLDSPDISLCSVAAPKTQAEIDAEEAAAAEQGEAVPESVKDAEEGKEGEGGEEKEGEKDKGKDSKDDKKDGKEETEKASNEEAKK